MSPLGAARLGSLDAPGSCAWSAIPRESPGHLPPAMGSAALGLGCARRLHSLPLHRAWPCTLQVEAGKKENAIVMARLRPRAAAAGAEFCVGSWHGPAAFGPPAKVQMAVLVNVAAGTPTPDHAQIVPRSCQTVPDHIPGLTRSYEITRQITCPRICR